MYQAQVCFTATDQVSYMAERERESVFLNKFRLLIFQPVIYLWPGVNCIPIKLAAEKRFCLVCECHKIILIHAFSSWFYYCNAVDVCHLKQSHYLSLSGTFKLTIEFTEEYPNKPPTVRFVSKMFHPNGMYFTTNHSNNVSYSSLKLLHLFFNYLTKTDLFSVSSI